MELPRPLPPLKRGGVPLNDDAALFHVEGPASEAPLSEDCEDCQFEPGGPVGSGGPPLVARRLRRIRSASLTSPLRASKRLKLTLDPAKPCGRPRFPGSACGRTWPSGSLAMRPAVRTRRCPVWMSCWTCWGRYCHCSRSRRRSPGEHLGAHTALAGAWAARVRRYALAMR